MQRSISRSVSIADSKIYHDNLTWHHPHESMEYSGQESCHRNKIILASYYFKACRLAAHLTLTGVTYVYNFESSLS